MDLAMLMCEGNQITSLDVSNNSGLMWLECGGNLLTSLDVSGLLNLYILNCGNNQLNSLDISENTSLGQVPWIDDHSCYLNIEDMPTLEEVCVWTLPFPPEEFKLCMDGSPNAYFTTECSR